MARSGHRQPRPRPVAPEEDEERGDGRGYGCRATPQRRTRPTRWPPTDRRDLIVPPLDGAALAPPPIAVGGDRAALGPSSMDLWRATSRLHRHDDRDAGERAADWSLGTGRSALGHRTARTVRNSVKASPAARSGVAIPRIDPSWLADRAIAMRRAQPGCSCSGWSAAEAPGIVATAVSLAVIAVVSIAGAEPDAAPGRLRGSRDRSQPQSIADLIEAAVEAGARRPSARRSPERE